MSLNAGSTIFFRKLFIVPLFDIAYRGGILLYKKRTTGLKTYNYNSIPIIHQIELVGGVCNLSCSSCPVTEGKALRKESFFSVELLKDSTYKLQSELFY